MERGIPEASRAFLAISGSLSNISFERWMSVGFATTVSVSRNFVGEWMVITFEGAFCYVLVSGRLMTKSNIKAGLGHKGGVHVHCYRWISEQCLRMMSNAHCRSKYRREESELKNDGRCAVGLWHRDEHDRRGELVCIR